MSQKQIGQIKTSNSNKIVSQQLHRRQLLNQTPSDAYAEYCFIHMTKRSKPRMSMKLEIKSQKNKITSSKSSEDLVIALHWVLDIQEAPPWPDGTWAAKHILGDQGPAHEHQLLGGFSTDVITSDLSPTCTSYHPLTPVKQALFASCALFLMVLSPQFSGQRIPLSCLWP